MRVPTLLIEGEFTITPPGQMREMGTARPGVRHLVINAAGHLVHDRPAGAVSRRGRAVSARNRRSGDRGRSAVVRGQESAIIACRALRAVVVGLVSVPTYAPFRPRTKVNHD